MNPEPPRVPTGVPHLDALLAGGLPRGSVSVISGPPGSGKTILAQQIAFANASPTERVLSFNTLSEPTAKTLRYLKPFRFFRADELEASVQFVDLGTILRKDGLDEAAALMTTHLKMVKPSLVIIDSFKVFDDLAASAEQQRKFGYEMAVNLMAWEATALLLGEYGARDFETNPLFSIVDGLFLMSQRELHGENQRFFRAWKLRGTNHSRDEVPFRIQADGVALYDDRVASSSSTPRSSVPAERCKFGVVKVDELLGDGIPRGSTVLLSGMAGTGKTVLSLEFLYRGAVAGERGIFFSFEETPERLIATARGLGWDLAPHLASGHLQLVFVPQPDISIEADVAMMRERIEASGAVRVVVDSVSVFLHKITDAQASREKVFHICSLMQTYGVVALLAADIPSGSEQISRFGVEETVVDGVILLSAVAEGMERERYIEVYKMRNTPHVLGRHNMVIGQGGVAVYPRFAAYDVATSPAPLDTVRLGSGVPGLDEQLGGGLLRRSVTLLSGSAGAGKTTAAIQFVLEGARVGERSLYVTLEEGAEQLCVSAAALGLPLREAVEAGHVEILHLSREQVRGVQFLSVLSDRLRSLDASRVVLDALTQLVSSALGTDELRHLIYRLMLKFKNMGVTTLLTLESNELVTRDGDTQRNLSPIADNLVLLRYAIERSELVPTLTVIKTRGSSHGRGSCHVRVGAGGLRLDPPLDVGQAS